MKLPFVVWRSPLRASGLRHIRIRHFRAMRIMAEPHRQLMSRLDFGEAQRSLDADELASCCATKAMDSAPLDIQGITSPAHAAFEAVFPVLAVILVQINEATREV